MVIDPQTAKVVLSLATGVLSLFTAAVKFVKTLKRH